MKIEQVETDVILVQPHPHGIFPSMPWSVSQKSQFFGYLHLQAKARLQSPLDIFVPLISETNWVAKVCDVYKHGRTIESSLGLPGCCSRV
jgi:hypothetical protein